MHTRDSNWFFEMLLFFFTLEPRLFLTTLSECVWGSLETTGIERFLPINPAVPKVFVSCTGDARQRKVTYPNRVYAHPVTDTIWKKKKTTTHIKAACLSKLKWPENTYNTHTYIACIY